tara:strand:- start:344 stop:550 length:207 start_codon:yes stop_codon:yes gene_type:complete
VLVLTFKAIGIECPAEAGVLENLLPAFQTLKDLVCKHFVRVHHFLRTRPMVTPAEIAHPVRYPLTQII